MFKYPIFVAGRDMASSWRHEGQAVPTDAYYGIVTAPRPYFDVVSSMGMLSAWVCDQSGRRVTLDTMNYDRKGISGSTLTPADPRDGKLFAEARKADSRRNIMRLCTNAFSTLNRGDYPMELNDVFLHHYRTGQTHTRRLTVRLAVESLTDLPDWQPELERMHHECRKRDDKAVLQGHIPSNPPYTDLNGLLERFGNKTPGSTEREQALLEYAGEIYRQAWTAVVENSEKTGRELQFRTGTYLPVKLERTWLEWKSAEGVLRLDSPLDDQGVFQGQFFSLSDVALRRGARLIRTVTWSSPKGKKTCTKTIAEVL